MNAGPETEAIRWFRAENGPGFQLPLWARTVALDREGTVYAAAATTGDEPGATLAASQEGVPILFDKASGRRFLPTAWMAREFPQIASICVNIEVTVRMHLAREAARDARDPGGGEGPCQQTPTTPSSGPAGRSG